eukprot:jgi/Botrbrau1/1923/Bobra.0005s0028.1
MWPPIFNGLLLPDGVRRINLGGKALTNYFKELVSYRGVNFDERDVPGGSHKGAGLLRVDRTWQTDFRRAKAGQLKLEYVLPDGVEDLQGYVREAALPGERREAKAHEHVLKVDNERFMVPELIFRPSDIGAAQGGIAEAVVDAVSAVQPGIACHAVQQHRVYRRVCRMSGVSRTACS